jgi:hypothetical protein
MNERNKEESGKELPLQLVLPLGSGGRGSMTATVAVTVLDDKRQMQFEVEIQDLLAHLVRRQVREGVGKCPTRIRIG